MIPFILSILVFFLAGLGNNYCSGICSAPSCDKTSVRSCILDLVHAPYTGTVAMTNHGLSCQSWSAQSPQEHTRTNDAYFPADGGVIGANNYCRNFEGSGRPWCYAIHEYIIWEYCDLRICNGIGPNSVTTLNSSPGMINSPDTDGDGLYDYSVDLLWIIEAPDGYIIKYQIPAALIKNSAECHKDGLKIIEADYFTDTTIICGNHLFNAKYNRGESYSNVLYVQFYSDYELSLPGFQLTFDFSEAQRKNCQYTLEQPSGWISSPDFDSDSLYDFNMNCYWTVEVDSDVVIRFQVLYVEIQYSYGCKMADYLKISDVYAILSLLCGFGGERPPMETRSNVMYVNFVSNNYLTHAGFNLTYQAVQKSVEVCGEIIHESSGAIISPDRNSDGFYDNNVNCHWTIIVADENVIRYELTYFEVEYSKDCDKDYLWIYEPTVSRNKVSLCGRLKIKDKYEGETIANALALEFRSDAANAYKGFEIVFAEKQVNTENHCGGTLKSSSGYITSPDFDDDGYYDFNVFCFWHIQVNPNASILYQFEYIQIEVTTGGCLTDYLRILNAVSLRTCTTCPVSSLFVGLIRTVLSPYFYSHNVNYCGFHNITDIERTMTNQLEMHFLSDSRLSSSGFLMVYRAMEKIQCGEILSDDSGWISQPHITQEGDLDKHLSCEWTIFAKPNKSIKFEIMYVIVQESIECNAYYLSISFAFARNRMLHYERFCGRVKLVKPYQARTDWVFFHFFARPNEDQFLVYYKLVDDLHYDYHGYILKTNDPSYITPFYQPDTGLYDYNLLMEWTIVADSDQTILLNILYIDIERDDYVCFKDFLRVMLNQHVICGVGTKIAMISSGNIVPIIFGSDYSVNKAGFNITFTPIAGGEAECGGVLTGSSGIIGSPDTSGSGTYDNFIDCFWTIQLHDDFVIIFAITEIDIQMDFSTCKADYLELKEDHKTRNRLCGSAIPTAFTTEANILHIHFHSDIVISGRGFRATYSQATDTKSCSEIYRCLLSSKTISKSNLCDYYFDCPYSDDERFCDFRCPATCVCFGLTIDCSGRDVCHTGDSDSVSFNITNNISIPPSARRLDVSTNPIAFSLMNLGKQNLSLLTHLNISYCDIAEIPKDFFVAMIRLKILDISFNKLRRLTSNMFVSQIVLERLYLAGNFEPVILESESFTGLDSLLQLWLSELYIRKISQSTFAFLNLTELRINHCLIDVIEDFSFGGLSVERIYMNSSVIKEFSESMLQGLKDLKMLKTEKYKFCCVRPKFLPEENCFPSKDEFSSCDDLIRNEVLRPLVWLIGLFAIFTNISSIAFRVMKQRTQLKRSYGMFVTNLAVSDCFVGFYLLIIATADSYFRNVYIVHDEFWRHSGWCKIAGIFSTISNEASVLFVCLITLDRLLVIKYPLGQCRLTLRHASMLSILVWITALATALIPVALYSLFEDNFYSQSGVCLPLPITRARLRGYSYSVGVFLGFNSVAYTLIAAGQWSIYREIKLSSKALAENRSKTNTDTKIARSLLIVAVTDLLCWLPVAILGILALSNQVIDSAVFSWVAVVVLPVNAAANPAIYTLSAAWQRKKSKQRPRDDNATDSLTIEYTGRWIDIWTDRIFWQRPGPVAGFISLTDALDTSCIDVNQRLVVARKISRMFHVLHSQNIIQKDFQAEDIFVTEANGIFHAADEDQKGFLTRHDLKTAVVELLGYKPTKYEVDQILDSFGEVIGDASDNKKGLSLEKFISCMSEKLVKRDIDEEIRHAFMAFDMQCHGFLTVDDLKKVFSKVAPHIPAEAVHSAFREIDQDGDGRISYKDFEYVMKYNTADDI